MKHVCETKKNTSATWPGELRQSVPLQVQVGELRGPPEDPGAQGGEVVVGQVQVEEVLHAAEHTAVNLADLAELQVEGDHPLAARETAAREVVEVVATEIEELRFGGKAAGDLGVAAALAGGMLRFHLRKSNVLLLSFSLALYLTRFSK